MDKECAPHTFKMKETKIHRIHNLNHLAQCEHENFESRPKTEKKERMPFSGVLNKSRTILISIICWVYTFGLVQMHTPMNQEANKGQTSNTKDIPSWIKVMMSPSSSSSSSSSLPPCSAAKQQRNVIRMLFGGWKYEKKNKSNDCIARFLFFIFYSADPNVALLG